MPVPSILPRSRIQGHGGRDPHPPGTPGTTAGNGPDRDAGGTDPVRAHGRPHRNPGPGYNLSLRRHEAELILGHKRSRRPELGSSECPRPLHRRPDRQPELREDHALQRADRAAGQGGNYAGVTVEKKRGRPRLGGRPERPVTILDLPGTYSLSPQSLDEQVARDVLFRRLPDVPEPSLIPDRRRRIQPPAAISTTRRRSSNSVTPPFPRVEHGGCRSGKRTRDRRRSPIQGPGVPVFPHGGKGRRQGEGAPAGRHPSIRRPTRTPPGDSARVQ